LIDGLRVTVSGQSRSVFPMQACELAIAVVQGVHQMRGRAPGFAASNLAAFEHDHRLARATQEVSRCEARDPAAHHAYVAPHVVVQRLSLRDPAGCGPDRMRPGGTVHDVADLYGTLS